MDITIVNQTNEAKWRNYKKDFIMVARSASQLLTLPDDLICSIVLVGDEMIKAINKEYRHKNVTTDVISFALHDKKDEFTSDIAMKELGDIFINVDAVSRQANEFQHSLRREISFLFAHGLLHLLGYDHMNQEDEKKMILLQKEILNEIPRKSEK